jgi:hypothetical protein
MKKLIKILPFLITSLILTLSGTPSFYQEVGNKYYQEYINITGYTGKSIEIKIKPMNRRYAGFCIRFHLSWLPTVYRVIQINGTTWKYHVASQRRSLIFHELGHCLHGLNHDNRLKADGCPESIMHKRILSSHCVHKHWDQYILDLKTKVHQ